MQIPVIIKRITSFFRLIPELVCEGDLIERCASSLMKSGHLRNDTLFNSASKNLLHKSFPGLQSLPISPFDQLIINNNYHSYKSLYTNVDLEMSDPKTTSYHQEQKKIISQTLSRVLHILSTQLVATDNKFLIFGCLEALSLLSEKYPPVLYTSAWDCHNMNKPNKSTDTSAHIGLITLVFSLAGETSLAGDLSAQQFIMNISTNILAGIAVACLEERYEEVKTSSQKTWKVLRTSQMMHMAENLIQHMMRILSVYHHVIDGVIPSTKPTTLNPVGAASALSPIKRRTRNENIVDKSRSHSPGNKLDRTDSDDKERKWSKIVTNKGHFTHLAEYIKLYDIIKNAYTNYTMSLDQSTEEKLCGLLTTTLNCLGRLLEVSSMDEFGELAEELLIYLKSATSLQATHTVFSGQQLLKCLFGSNLYAFWDQLCKKINDPLNIKTTTEVIPGQITPPDTPKNKQSSFHQLVFTLPHYELEYDIKQVFDETVDTVSKKSQKKVSSKIQAKVSDKTSLSSYIKLFEPLVIKALKLYTISSNVIMQKSVLQLLIHLVQIRVNYCLLDSDQIFIGYVIDQFDYIEEGQIR